MIHLPPSVRVYLCLTPCDMRKSFDALPALVRDYLELDAFAGHCLFLPVARMRCHSGPMPPTGGVRSQRRNWALC